MDLFTLMEGQVTIFLLVLARVLGIFTIAPFLGSMSIPMLARVVTGFTMALVLFPIVSSQGAAYAPETIVHYAGALLGEMFVGWFIGFVAYAVLSAINFAGKVMDMQVGFAMINVMDPTSGQQIPLIGSFLYNLMIIVFVVVNGHHMLITALFESFQTIPLLMVSPDPSIALFVSNLVHGIFSTGMKLALPVTFAVLLTNVGLGILARTMPQLNIFVVGLPLQIIIGLFTLSMLLPFYVLFLGVLFNESYEKISLMLRLLS